MSKRGERHVFREIIKHHAIIGGSTQRQARIQLEYFFEFIAHVVERDGRCFIPGFGTFIATTRKARLGRNPVNGDAIWLPETKSVRFRPSKRGVFGR